MTGREVLKRIRQLGGRELRQAGSHVRVECRCGSNKSSVPLHKGHEIKTGTLHGIESDLEPCLGEHWLLGDGRR